MRSQLLSGPPMELLLVSVVYVHVALIMLISSNGLRAHAVSFLDRGILSTVCNPVSAWVQIFMGYMPLSIRQEEVY